MAGILFYAHISVSYTHLDVYKRQLFGRTEQNRVVVFDRGTQRVGDFVNVRVTEASSATRKGEEV